MLERAMGKQNEKVVRKDTHVIAKPDRIAALAAENSAGVCTNVDSAVIN
jgi:hypothetical protein